MTLGLGIEQVFILGDLQLAASLNSKWVDDQVSGFWNLEHEKIDAYTTTDLTLTLEPSNAAWSVSAFALNLEDKRRIEATQASPMGMAMTTYGAPLTYGLRLGINF